MMDLKKILGNNSSDALVQQKLDQLFRTWSEAKDSERVGLHASSMVATDSDFCYREHVLATFYRKNPVNFPTHLLRIFLHGWWMHIKWQTLFEEQGIAVAVEKQRISKKWLGVTLTPDAIIEIFGKKYVVEIKSMNTYQFKKLTKPPANAVRQANFYMYNTGIPRAIVLVDDKNDQNFKAFVIEYDPEIARPFIVRLNNLKKLIEIFKRKGKLPRRICDSENSKRAKTCPMRESCFASKSLREKKYRLKKA